MHTVVASTPADWRAWLMQHSRLETEVWLVIHHKDSATPSVRYHEAIEHALCFGWIDGLHRKRDAHSSQLRFTLRSSRSTWSRVNRQRVENMSQLGLMTEYGCAMVDLAKANGTWQVLPDDASSAILDDLRDSLDRNDAAHRNFQSFPPSSKRLIAEWIVTARKPETRQRRINQAINLAATNIRANHPGIRMGPAR